MGIDASRFTASNAERNLERIRPGNLEDVPLGPSRGPTNAERNLERIRQMPPLSQQAKPQAPAETAEASDPRVETAVAALTSAVLPPQAPVEATAAATHLHLMISVFE